MLAVTAQEIGLEWPGAGHTEKGRGEQQFTLEMRPPHLAALPGNQRLNVEVRHLILGNEFEMAITVKNHQVLICAQLIIGLNTVYSARFPFIVHRRDFNPRVAKAIFLEQSPD